ncbi:OmpA family protein [Moraxella osloensis]|uniref:OmpA family protein n=1 Tax=Faucicola osloensis TaxID=34062 RepID=A0A6P1KP12_FAUOS|nr:OmpA family protein [Moraxella osloensis]QHG10185.1 OmpA family protein [Moraxella osloensis]
MKNRLKIRSDVTAVIIAGTSSDEGDFKAEKMQLSKQRALQLKNAFIRLMGIDPNNTIAIGCGDYNAIANEHSENGSALNRRIYMQFGSDIDNRQLVLDKFGQLKAPYKHCEIAH